MAKKLRIKCPLCNKVNNIPEEGKFCPECQRPIEPCTEACIYLYRQGSPLGVASGFGIYLNGEAYGHIGNKEILCFPLPYGTYTIHCAAGMNRKCKDLQITLTPENRVAYAKVFMKPGFWSNSFVVEPIDPKLLDLN